MAAKESKLPGSWGRFCRHLIKIYLSIDPRTLGFFRILFGFLLIADLLRRVPDLSVWYSNEGLLPNSTMLAYPMQDWTFSFFFALGTPAEAAAAFVICGIIFFFFLLGWKTKIFQFLTLFCVTSLHSRNVLFENAGNTISNSLCFFTLFLPLGRCFSLDSLLARRNSPPDASDGFLPAASRSLRQKPIVSLAVFALLAQLSIIYFFNAVQKTGPTWKGGLAVHYALYMDYLGTWFGGLVREHFPVWLSQGLSWGTLILELSAPALILSPIFTLWTRRTAIVLLSVFHLGISLLINLGLFSWTMIVFLSLLLSAEDWDYFQKAPAFRGFRKLAGRWSLGAFRLLGRGNLSAPARSPGPGWLGKALIGFRELLIVFALMAIGSEILVINPVIPPNPLRTHQPVLLKAFVGYLKMQQGWLMFAPDVPTKDKMIVVDAVTVDGRHVDPFNEAASGLNVPMMMKKARPPGLKQFWSAYSNIIPGFPQYQPALSEWILRYPRRTGRPNDQIVAFDVYLSQSVSPGPGENSPRNLEKIRFLSYRPPAQKK